jgi:hypothetical protein
MKAFSFETQYGANVETARPMKVEGMKVLEPAVVEGYSAADLVKLYNDMTDAPHTRRKYDMDSHVRYSQYHPEYIPDTHAQLLRDSEQVINQQMMTMGITIAATASLALIAFMVSSSPSSPQ